MKKSGMHSLPGQHFPNLLFVPLALSNHITPHQVRREFPNVLAQQNAHADYVHLLESISAVLGAQRQPKADLLEEPTSSGGISHSISGHVLVYTRKIEVAKNSEKNNT